MRAVPGQRQIAQRTGVTQATVSRVRTNVVCVVHRLPPAPLANPWTIGLLDGIEERLSDAGQQLLLVHLRERRLPASLRAGQVDGVLAIVPEPALRSAFLKLDVPVVGVANQILPIHASQDARAVADPPRVSRRDSGGKGSCEA
jgi:DNA-binding LacI/PurR family transcriptional regulator